MCTHYVVKLFELLSKEYKVDFYFTGGDEDYWDKRNNLWTGNFNGQYLRGFRIFKKFKITPQLLELWYKDYDFFIKTIENRFALPFVFLTAKIKKRPFILWTQLWMHPRTFFHRFFYGFMKFIYRHCDAIIVYGPHVKNYLMDLKIPEHKIFIAPQSMDNEQFNRPVGDEEKQRLLQELNLSGKKIVLYVGRLEECKGLIYLMEAISWLEDLNVSLLLIGTGTQKSFLEKKSKELSVRTLFLGHISNEELYRYYALTDVFVLPSITTANFKEPWGIVVNEAMNQGCPVVATDAVGAAVGGLVIQGKNGFVVPERNSFALKEALEKILKDDVLKSQMAAESKKNIEDWTPRQTLKGFIKAIEFACGATQKS